MNFNEMENNDRNSTNEDLEKEKLRKDIEKATSEINKLNSEQAKIDEERQKVFFEKIKIQKEVNELNKNWVLRQLTLETIGKIILGAGVFVFGYSFVLGPKLEWEAEKKIEEKKKELNSELIVLNNKIKNENFQLNKKNAEKEMLDSEMQQLKSNLKVISLQKNIETNKRKQLSVFAVGMIIIIQKLDRIPINNTNFPLSDDQQIDQFVVDKLKFIKGDVKDLYKKVFNRPIKESKFKVLNQPYISYLKSKRNGFQERESLSRILADVLSKNSPPSLNITIEEAQARYRKALIQVEWSGIVQNYSTQVIGQFYSDIGITKN